jgi:nicotinamide mononucleotide transporter
VFYENRFYSDAYLQVIFFIFQSYGWYSWIQQSKLKNHSNSNNHPSIRSLTPKLLLISIPLFFVFWGCYCFAYLQLFDNPRAPLIDTFLTSVSLLALYWQAKRFIENWHLWIVADLLYVPLYFWGGQYITALLYTIFIGLAFWGWKSWKKEKATH